MIVAAVAFAAMACAGDLFNPSGPDSKPATIASAVGDTLRADVATSVAIAATVLDAGGNPVQGSSVMFAITSGGGSLATTTAQTDNLGQASIMWTLGTRAGPQTATATADGLSPVVFTAIAEPGAALTLDIAGGGNQSAIAGTAVPTDPSVRALDTYGNPVPNAMVLFQARNGGSANGRTDGNAASAFTNADGIATVHWILGPSVGADTLLARLNGTVAPIALFANGIAPAP
ncbi:MAG TPA: Ig-like domain-containing protein [Gemmatimonadaceae bacterium]|nr:Ig-like domain-containing protein [Gemmatimonadaceae bacterium]